MMALDPVQDLDGATQKARSSGVSLGLERFRTQVASCWRSASSTIACSLRLRKKARVLRMSSAANSSRDPITGEILDRGSCSTSRILGSDLEYHQRLEGRS